VWHLDDGGFAIFDDAISLPTITVFVAEEEDDGLEFNEGGNDFLILEGTSTLP
jgi:hypothetical protein